jgi:hypothetical protein
MTARPAAEPEGIVGRVAEIDVVHWFIESARRSGGALVLVGDAGVGNSPRLAASGSTTSSEA